MGNLGSAMIPGRVDKKYVALLGLGSNTYPIVGSNAGEKFMLPVGTFLLSSSNGDQQKGKLTQSGHCYDIVREFKFTVNDDFPHTLYGQQDPGINPRYDPAYNLVCTDGIGHIWQCDAVAFMTQPSDNVFFSSDFQSLFAYVGNNGGVNVYSSHYTTPPSGSGLPTQGGIYPIPPADSTFGYSWDATTGTVVFSQAQNLNSVISVDGKPQGMSPENMLKHLFVDYGGYDPAYLSWMPSSDNPDPALSNIVLPVYVGGRDKAIWDIGQDIANMTAPRMVAYVLRVDELGRILFYESKTTSTPSEFLTDERDIIDMQWTYTDEQIVNVVTADARSNDNQPLTSLAYDIKSITENGQRAVYQIPDELLLTTRGMNSYYALSFMNMLTASKLFQSSQPILQLTLDVLPNPLRQVGDKIYINSATTPFTGVYVIKGVTDQIQKSQYKQQLRVQRARLFNNFAMGMPTALTNDSSQSAQVVDDNSAAVAGQTGICDTIKIGGTKVFSGGQQVLDTDGNPVIAVVHAGDTWDWYYSISPNMASDTYVWRFWYMECQNSLSSTEIMVMREANWLSNDGSRISQASIISGYNNTTTHSDGMVVGSQTAYLRSNIIVAPSPEFLPFGYNAALTSIGFGANTTTLTVAASAGDKSITVSDNSIAVKGQSIIVGTGVGQDTVAVKNLSGSHTINLSDPLVHSHGNGATVQANNAASPLGTASTGLGLGTPFTGNFAYFPMNKQNYGYFCLLLVNTNGAVQFVNMPFIFQL